MPRGRPKGSKNKTTNVSEANAEKALRGHCAAALAQIVDVLIGRIEKSEEEARLKKEEEEDKAAAEQAAEVATASGKSASRCGCPLCKDADNLTLTAAVASSLNTNPLRKAELLAHGISLDRWAKGPMVAALEDLVLGGAVWLTEPVPAAAVAAAGPSLGGLDHTPIQPRKRLSVVPTPWSEALQLQDAPRGTDSEAHDYLLRMQTGGEAAEQCTQELPPGLEFDVAAKGGVLQRAVDCIIDGRAVEWGSYYAQTRNDTSRLSQAEFVNVLVGVLHCAQWTLSDYCTIGMEASMGARERLRASGEGFRFPLCCCVVVAGDATWQCRQNSPHGLYVVHDQLTQ